MKIFGFLVAVLFLPSSIALAKDSMPLETYLERLLEQDPAFKDLLLERDIDLRSLDATLQRWDVNVSLGGTQRQNEGEDSFTKNVRVSSDIPESATSLELSYQNNAITSLFTDVTALQLNQRLWNNGFGTAYQLQKQQLNLQTELAQLRFMESVEAYLAAAASEYLDYYLNYETLQYLRRNLDDARNLERNVAQRYRSRIALEGDLLQAQVRTLEAETRLQQTESELETVQRTLRERLGYSKSPGVPQLPNISAGVAGEKPLDELRSTQIAQLQREIAETRSDAIKDTLRPATDAFLGVENRQLRGSSSAQDYYYLGFQIDVPVRQSQKRFGLAEQKLIAERQALQITLTSRDIKTKRDELSTQISVLQKQLESRRKIALMLQKVSEEEQRRFNQGLVGLREVITARQSFEDMRLQLLQDDIALQRAQLQWLALNDQLLGRFLKPGGA